MRACALDAHVATRYLREQPRLLPGATENETASQPEGWKHPLLTCRDYTNLIGYMGFTRSSVLQVLPESDRRISPTEAVYYEPLSFATE